jgi:hypothetical protein
LAFSDREKSKAHTPDDTQGAALLGALLGVVITAGFLTPHRTSRAAAAQEFNGLLYVVHQQAGQVAAHPQPRYHTLHDEVSPVRRHRISGHLPAFTAQPVGEIVQVEPRILAGLDRPRAARQSAASVIDQIEDLELAKFIGKPRANLRTTLRDFSVALFSETNKVVVLRHNLSPRP